MKKLGKSIVSNYQEGTEREFLLSNGMGSYCGFSINGNYSRRYHGLLISSFLPPLDRFMTFHKIEESLNDIDLFTSKQKKDASFIIKDGYKYLDSFSLNPFPEFIYSIDGTILKKELFMIYGEETIVVNYKVLSSVKKENKLKLKLFLNYRDLHDMTENISSSETILKENFFETKLENSDKSLYIYSNKIQNFIKKEERKTNIVYDIEAERGDDKTDSSFSPGYIEVSLKEGEEIFILASMKKQENIDISRLREKELNRIENLKNKTSKDFEFLRDLSYAGDHFIVYREGTQGKTILAGYPWFGDWGRDTMIALPGLTLSTGRFEDAKSILSTFAKYCTEGMLPNKFPDWEGEELMYNTIDASLWYFYAVDKYISYTSDYDFIKNEIYKSLEDIIKYHIKGTRYKIKVDENDGLISGGDKNTQLTWMDVKYKSWAVTPRFGKAVEINALWYNALKVMEKLAEKFGYSNEVYKKYAKKIEENFEKEFWNEEKSCLYDYIYTNEKAEVIKNDDIRPNQIFTISLPYTILDEEKSKKIVDVVTEKLYTPNGLRSLSKDNEKYIGIYKGDLFERDACYHQGTVWSWPIGHYISAYNKIYKNKEKVKLLIEGLKNHFYQEACINNISEVFDGDYPNKARACYAQAWSVGELIRIIKEEL